MSHLDLVRSILAGQGFIATVATDYVLIELKCRSVSMAEVFKALYTNELDELCRLSSNYDGRVRVYPVE